MLTESEHEIGRTGRGDRGDELAVAGDDGALGRSSSRPRTMRGRAGSPGSPRSRGRRRRCRRAASSRPRSRSPAGSPAPGRVPPRSPGAAIVVEVAVVEQGVAVAVVGGEAAAGVGLVGDERQQVVEVVLARPLADHHHQTGPELFAGLLEGGRFVVGAGTGAGVGLQRGAAQAGGVTVAPPAGGDGRVWRRSPRRRPGRPGSSSTRRGRPSPARRASRRSRRRRSRRRGSRGRWPARTTAR